MDITPSDAADRLVDDLVRRDVIRSPRIEAAFRAVPRHLFLPGMPLSLVYTDEAIPTKRTAGRFLSSSSQPAMMAIMLEQLELQPGQRVLELGAGTGYNAALLAHLTAPGGHITTVDVDLDTTVAARRHLEAAGFPGVDVICADGREGWPPAAPYDRIIATAAIESIPPAWRRQLNDGGIIVAPVGDSRDQRSVALHLINGQVVQRSAVPCGFMFLRDAHTERAW
jgi:protein-L-isoaspartate(D-aspartate) O-methyltransferase